jgi:hypothetical protein
MLLVKYLFITLTFLCLEVSVLAQFLKRPEYRIEAGSVLYTGNQMPFWLYSNQNGLIMPDKNNFYIKGAISTEFSSSKKIDYAYGLEFANRVSGKNEFYLPQAYLKLKLYDFQFSAGNFYSNYGNQDYSLSSGGLVWSTNARTFPRISIEVPVYTAVPFTNGYVEYMGGISHGWLGSKDSIKRLWLHHKYLFLRFGGKLPVNFHIGLHHFAQWGGETRYGQMPSDFAAFKKIFFVQAGDMDNSLVAGEWINKLGNHIGSFNIGTDIKLEKYTCGFYWQTIFEDQSGMKFRNLKDGLWGIYLHSKETNRVVNGFVYEFINTTNQSGTRFMVNGVKVEGNDNYFNHGIYFNGWSYKDMTIGTPFITSPALMHGSVRDYFRNNKIRAHHIGLEGGYNKITYKFLYSFVENYGTNRYPFNSEKVNHSLLLKTVISEVTSYKIDLGLSVGADLGSRYGKNVGIMLSIIKKGNF